MVGQVGSSWVKWLKKLSTQTVPNLGLNVKISTQPNISTHNNQLEPSSWVIFVWLVGTPLKLTISPFHLIFSIIHDHGCFKRQQCYKFLT